MALQADYSQTPVRDNTTERKTDTGGAVRFATLVVISTGVMFGIMHMNSFALDHMQGSQTLMWLAVYIGGSAALVSLGLLAGIFTHPKANIAIVAGSLIALGIGLGAERFNPATQMQAKPEASNQARQQAESNAHQTQIEKIESYVTGATFNMRPAPASRATVPG